MPGIADAIGGGRVRLDAIARWLQDVAYADLLDAGFDEGGVWIVRRVRLRVDSFPRFGEPVTLRTYCSGLGRFAAERRTTIARRVGGRRGGRALGLDRRVGPPGEVPGAVRRALRRERRGPRRAGSPTPSRAAARGRAHGVDLPGRGHRRRRPRQQLPLLGAPRGAPRGLRAGRIDTEIEHRDPARPGAAFVVGDGDGLWIESAEGALHASIQVAGGAAEARPAAATARSARRAASTFSGRARRQARRAARRRAGLRAAARRPCGARPRSPGCGCGCSSGCGPSSAGRAPAAGPGPPAVPAARSFFASLPSRRPEALRKIRACSTRAGSTARIGCREEVGLRQITRSRPSVAQQVEVRGRVHAAVDVAAAGDLDRPVEAGDRA